MRYVFLNAWKSHTFGKLQTAGQTVHVIIHVIELYNHISTKIIRMH